MEAVTDRSRATRPRAKRQPSPFRSELYGRGLLPMAEAAKAMGVSTKRLRGMCRRGDVPSVLVAWRGTQHRAVPAAAVGR